MVQLMPLPPSSLAPVKSRMVCPSGAGLPRPSWKKGRKFTKNGPLSMFKNLQN